MLVSSSQSVLYNVQGQRYKKLSSAEAYLRSLGAAYARLQQTGQVNIDGNNLIKYLYEVPIEPYINVARNIYLLCGDSVTLSATATGVPLSQLTLLWTQQSGTVGTLVTPEELNTLFIRQDSDKTDKIFQFSVLDTVTGVQNTIHEKLYATPTDITYFSGGIPTPFKLDVPNWLTPYSSQADRVRVGDSFSYINSRVGYLYIRPYQNNLIRIEVYSSGTGRWVLVASKTVTGGDNFVLVPSNIFTIPTTVKVRLVYQFGNGAEEYVETPVEIYTKARQTAVINDKVNLTGYNTSDIRNFSTDELRLQPVTTTQTDSANVVIVYAPYSDFNTDTFRSTYITNESTDNAYVSIYYGNVYNFNTTIQRQTGGQIGGG